MKEKINPEKGYKTKHMNLQLFAGETITDLTGTEWELNNSLNFANFPSNPILTNINFTSNNEDFTVFYPIGVDNAWSFYYFNTNTYSSVLPYSSDIWVNIDYKIISFTGGTDATNTDLISWLQLNATPIQTGYSSTINLTNCACNKSSESGLSGSYTAMITANNGYYLGSDAVLCSDVTAVITPVGENQKSVTISIPEVTEDFTITATGTAATKKTIIMHPNNNGTTDYTTKVHPTLNKASSDDIDDIFFGPWEAPTQEGEDLSLSQAYSATQNGDTLTLE